MTDLNQPARNFMPTQFRCVISFVVEEKGVIDWQSKKTSQENTRSVSPIKKTYYFLTLQKKTVLTI